MKKARTDDENWKPRRASQEEEEDSTMYDLLSDADRLEEQIMEKSRQGADASSCVVNGGCATR